MIRAVLAVMAGLLCGFAGFRHASTLTRDAVRLRRWVQLLSHLTLLLRQGLMPIPQALQSCADGHTDADRLLQSMVYLMQKKPMLSLAEAFGHCCSSGNEQPVLQRMFNHLGHGLQENRCRAVQQATEELRMLADQAASRAEKDVRLWQTLGLIGGLCLTILLL